jgi:alkanesulfonate monooxygenase
MTASTTEQLSAARPAPAATPVQLFSTCPESSQCTEEYAASVIRAARWSENAGCTGTLVYTDNSLVDPWLVAQIVIQNTRSLSPLVAVQPVYMHPYSVAKMVSTLGFLYGRRVFLNMVAGGFKNDLNALRDSTPHDGRYERLVEYTRIIQNLLDGEAPVTFEGKYYSVTNLVLNPPLHRELRGEFLMSGSSDAGVAAARETAATAVRYPEPPGVETHLPQDIRRCGIRIGIVTRPEEHQAWTVAYDRFPEDRKGRLIRQLASKVSDSIWHKRLTEVSAGQQAMGTYWLHPFENYQTNCPYLVGSYENVARELARYLNAGYRTFILDIPSSEEEFHHMGVAFESATSQAGLPAWQRPAQA